jgi:glyoxylase-like metal-dependent hydrolase (beta-lactamase superfamily II)
MKPATRLKEIAKGLYCWSSFHDQWKIDFNSYALQSAKGVVFVDPIKPTASLLKNLEALGEPAGIYLTNAHHDRAAHWFRKRYQIQIYAHEKAQADCDTKIDVPVLDGEKLPGGLKAIHLPGATPGGVAFYSKMNGGTLMLGDSILNHREKGLMLLPDQYCEDGRLAKQSLNKVLDLRFKIVTFAHGDPICQNAKKQIAAILKKRGKQSR